MLPSVERRIWMDGGLVDGADATVHVLTHALHYGSGVFEGIRAYATERGPALWDLDAHLDRLYASARVFHMDVPYRRAELATAMKDVVAASGLASCYVRPLVYRGLGPMGVDPLGAPVHVAVAALELDDYLGGGAFEHGVRVKVSSWKRPAQDAVPSAAKATGGYLVPILAKVEALKAGYDEAILLNDAGSVAEGSAANVFVVRAGVLATPPPAAGALPGVTSAAVVALARDHGYPVMERQLVRTDLYLADEVFLTGTATELIPVREIDDRAIGDGGRGPVTRALQDAFVAATRGRDPRYASRLTYVRPEPPRDATRPPRRRPHRHRLGARIASAFALPPSMDPGDPDAWW